MDPRVERVRYRGAPWFHPTGAQEEDLIEWYVDRNKIFPGYLHVWVNYCFVWQNCTTMPIDVVIHDRGGRDSLAQTIMVHLTYQRRGSTQSENRIPEEYGLDVPLCRTKDKIGFGHRLVELAQMFPNIGQAAQVSLMYLCWVRPIISAYFRYLHLLLRSTFLQMIRF